MATRPISTVQMVRHGLAQLTVTRRTATRRAASPPADGAARRRGCEAITCRSFFGPQVSLLPFGGSPCVSPETSIQLRNSS
jgi:hypothetical protein